MAVISQQALSAQLIAQLRLLDPAVSAEIGTPERKIIDTVAQSLHDSQVDLSALEGALDVDSKYGAALDRLLAIFGFSRQKATYATGYATFSRGTPSTSDIRIPAGTIVYAPNLGDGNGSESVSIQAATLYEATLSAGNLSVIVPVRSQIAGEVGNLAAGRITSIVGTISYGITNVTNDTPLTGGIDAETDDEYKVRFKNTVFRNLAGTEDQYLALAIARAYTSKAIVIGPQSFFREYIQIPPVADNESYTVDGSPSPTSGNGSAGQYTTALSSLPYAKAIYADAFPVFVTSGSPSATSIFYRPEVDFTFNTSDFNRNKGDAYRFATLGKADSPFSPRGANRPNFTLTNIYSGENPDVVALRPNEIILAEYSYLSSASRNNLELNITNAVDVYIDGDNLVQASTMITRPKTTSAFVDNVSSKYHFENYRRVGSPTKRPLIGNVLTPMFWQPVEDVPDSILVGTTTYFRDIHYWAVADVTNIGASVRGRSGIEWSTIVPGFAPGDSLHDQLHSEWTGRIITDATGDPVGGEPIPIEGYVYDRNVTDLQASLDGSKQVTTDVLAHKARIRWFKLDVSVMYQAGAATASVDQDIRSSVDAFLRSQYFGAVIQLSDLLQVIHGVPGVDNVRWTSDIPGNIDDSRVFETDRNGRNLTNVDADEISFAGDGITRISLHGSPERGTFSLRADIGSGTILETGPIPSTMDPATIETIVETAFSPLTVGITVGPTSTDPRDPYTSLDLVTPGYTILEGLDPAKNTLAGGAFTFDEDWILRDNEQARLAETTDGDISSTLPGLIIRPRAQNTWQRGR